MGNASFFRIWNRRHFALWLSRQPKKMELDTYLSPKHNRDICLVSSYIALQVKVIAQLQNSCNN